MPNETKIATNKILALLMSPSLAKFIDKLSRPQQVSISNSEIDTAMMALKHECFAEIEAISDEYQDYKHNQEHNVECLLHYMGELFKQENDLQQQKLHNAIRKQ